MLDKPARKLQIVSTKKADNSSLGLGSETKALEARSASVKSKSVFNEQPRSMIESLLKF